MLLSSFTYNKTSPQLINVSGKYKTDFGNLTLVQNQSNVTGSYSYPSKDGEILGNLKGELKGLILQFTWEQNQKNVKISGNGEFKFINNGKAFIGTWKDKSGKTGTWSGAK